MSEELPKTWPLVTNPLNRGTVTTQDAKIVNAYAEKNPQEGTWDVIKRPGLRKTTGYDSLPGIAGQGIFTWVTPLTADLYSIQFTSFVTARLYKNTTDLGAVNASGTQYWFQPVKSATPTLFFGNTGAYYTTDGTTITAIADAFFINLYGTLVGGIASLNGWIYVMDRYGNIYNSSNLNDATVWNALGVIVANDSFGNAKYLTRHLQYILAIKDTNIEVFEDIGNPAPGSPLARVPGVRIPYGCTATRTIASLEDKLFWVGSGVTGNFLTNIGNKVIMMQGLTPQPISNPYVERLIGDAESLSGQIILFNGHRFYVLMSLSPTNISTIAYDIEEGVWVEWEFASTIAITGSAQYSGLQLLQNQDGLVYQFDTTRYYDQTTTFNVDIVTPNMDFGTSTDKVLDSMYFLGQQQPGCVVQVRRTDDDFRSWSNFRPVDLSLKKPFITNEGTFSRRAYNFRYAGNTAMRLRSVGISLSMGMF